MFKTALATTRLLNSTSITRIQRATAVALAGILTSTAPALAINDNALPTGGSVASGSATFDPSIPNQLNINQTSNRVVIDWSTYNIGKDGTVQYNQLGASSVAVNRVTDVNPSKILGTLRANGQVIILNQNGVIFGKNAHVDVAGLLASTGTIDADSFMSTGAVNLSGINAVAGAKVVNKGQITIQQAGLAAFVAPNVINNGTIEAKLGKIALASGGDRATVDMYGDGLVEMQLDANASKALINNKGTLNADGGVIAITAKGAANVVNSTINLGGIVEANTVGVKNGKIILGATNADIKVTGSLKSQGKNIEITTDGASKGLSVSGSISTSDGGNIVADLTGHLDILSGGSINANGGNIKLDQTGAFTSADAGSVQTSGTGTISLVQRVGGSIQNAVAAIKNLGNGLNTVKVGDGTYNENVLIDQSNFKLVSENGKDSTTINGQSNVGALGAVTIGSDVNNVQLGANGKGFKIKGIDNGIAGIENSAVYLQGAHDGVTIQGNTIVARGDEALTTEYGAVNTNIVVDNNTITGKTYQGATSTIGDQFSDPNVARELVVLQNGIDGLQFTNNTVKGNSGDANLVDIGASDATISGNTIKGKTTATELRIREETGVTVSGNTINGNDTAENAIWAKGTNGLTIDGNNDISHADTGIYGTNVNALDIDTNHIHDVGSFGIYLDGGTVQATRAIINHNTINGVGAHAIHTRDNQYATITDNTIYDTSVGITTENFYSAAADGQRTLIDGNDITARDIGIRNNLSYGDQSGFTISNNTIKAQAPAAGDARRWTGIDVISQQGGVATNFTTNDIDGSNAGAGRQSAGYELTNMTNANRATIDGGTIKNVTTGIWATDGSSYTGAVSDLLIKNVNFLDISEEAILAEDTTDVNNDPGINVNNTSTHITIGSGNTFTNSGHDLTIGGAATVSNDAGFGGLSEVFIEGAGPAHYVGSPYGTTTTLTVGNASINAGIALVADGGTVDVGAGTFDEDVIVNKSVHLKGANAGISAADGSVRNPETIITPHSPGFYITANGASVDGFDVEGASNAFLIQGASGVTISNNIAHNSSANAIYFNGSANGDAEGNYVNGTGDTGHGIAFENGSNGGKANANKVNHTGYNGIYSSNGTGMTFTNNTLTDTGYYTDTHPGVVTHAISIENGSGLISANQIDDAAQGILLYNTTAPSQVWGNTISNTSNEGIIVQNASNADIQLNTVNNTAKDGIAIYDSANSKVLNNQIGLLGLTDSIGSGANGGDAIFVTNSDGTTIQGNKTANTHYNGPLRKGSGILVTNSDNVQIGGAGTLGNDVALAGSDGIVVRTDGGTADNNTIEGNTIHGAVGSRTGIYTENATHTKILNNTINGTGRYAAIYGYGGSDFTISGNTLNHNEEEGILLQNAGGTNLISANTIDNTGENVKSSDGTNVGDAIHVQNTSGLTISKNQIGTHGGSVQGDGIYVSGSNGVVIKGNTTNDTKFKTADANGANGSGIQVVNTDGATIGGAGTDANTMTNADWDGIRLQDDNNVTANNNSIDNIARVGIYAGNVTNSTLENNAISNTTRYGGIYAEGGGNFHITGNTINHADEVGILVQNATNGVFNIIDNNTIDNTGEALKSSDGSNSGDGVRVVNANGLVATNNKIGTHGAINGNGIYVDPSNGALIATNTINGAALNGVYSLNNNDAVIEENTITGSGQDGILVVGGNNVTIGGPSSGYKNTVKTSGKNGIEVQNTTGNVAINNNVVRGAIVNGIVTSGANAPIITNNQIDGPIGQDGINVSGNGTKATVDGNFIDLGDDHATGGSNNSNPTKPQNADTTTTRDGIHVVNSAGSDISTNKITNTGANGIYIDPSPNTTVYGNAITNAGTNGIYSLNNNGIIIGGLASGQRNTINGAGANGILVENTNNNTNKNNTSTVQNNTITGAILDGIQIANGAGALVDSNQITGGNASGSTTGKAGAGRDGIHVANNKGVIISNNTIAGGNNVFLGGTGGNGAGHDGIYVTGSDNANINHNTVKGSSSLLGGGIGAAMHGIEIAASKAAHIVSNTIYQVTHDGILATGSDNLDISLNTIGNGLVFGAGDNGIEVSGGKAAVIDHNTIKGGALNAKGAGNDGIHVVGNQSASITNNTIQGGLLIGSEGAGRDGIYAENDGSGLSGFFNLFSNANGVTITGNTIKNTGLSKGAVVDGIHVLNSASGLLGAAALIGTNTVTLVGNDGIFVDKTAGVNVLTNTVTLAGDDGIEVDNSDAAQIKSNNKVTLSGDVGILVDPSNLVTVDGNTISLSGSYGLQIIGGSLNTVSNNTISLSGDDGVRIDNNNLTKVYHNTISLSGGDGVEINGGLGGNTVDDNTISLSDANGVYFHDSALGKVTNNTISLSGANGVEADNAQAIEVGPNTISLSAKDGVHVTNSLLANIHNNTVTLSGGNGIFLDGSALAKINDNMVSLSGADGIYANNVAGLTVDGNTVALSGSDGIEANNIISGDITNNTVTLSGKDGIALTNAALVDIDTNTVALSGGNGIFVDPSAGINITNNTVVLSGADGIYATDVAGLNIQNNTVALSGNNGIEVQNSALVDVSGNGVFLSGNDGILANNILGLSVDGNTVALSDNNGISLNTVGLGSVEGNTVGLSGNDGISATDIAAVDIDGNNVFLSGNNGIAVNGAAVFSVDGNIVTLSGNNGIKVSDAALFSIDDNIVTLSGNNGIKVKDAALGTIDGNIVTLSGNNGISASGILGVGIDGNIVTLSGNNGIKVSDAALFSVDDNTVTLSGNNGIKVKNAALGTIDGNTVALAGHDGIKLDNTIGTVVANNTIALVGHDGVSISDSALSLIAGNTVIGALHDGIGLDHTIATLVVGNDVALVGHDGISDDNGIGSIIAGNTVIGALHDGISLNHTIGTAVAGNLVALVGNDGIAVRNSALSIVAANDVVGALHNGITLDHTIGTVVLDNGIALVGNDGIHVGDSAASLVFGNQIAFAGADGIDTEDSSFVGIAGNTVDYVLGNGVKVGHSNDILVGGNAIGQNGFIGGNGVDIENSSDVLVAFNGIFSNVQGDGIFIDPSFNVDLVNNLVDNVGGIGIHVAGLGNGLITLAGNTVNSLPGNTGARFESGQIDLTGATNTFNGGLNGLEFDGTEVSLIGDTIGTTAFNGQSQYYVQLSNGALFDPGQPTHIDGYHATFDGLTASAMSPAQYLNLTNKIFDFNDDDTLGLFFPLLSGLDQNELLPYQKLSQFNPKFGGSVTILGLPLAKLGAIGTGIFGNLQNIAPAAGGDEQGADDRQASAFDLNQIDSAAGSETVNTWDSVYSHLGAHAGPVTFNLEQSPQTAIAQGI